MYKLRVVANKKDIYLAVAVLFFGVCQSETNKPTNQTSLELIQLQPVIYLATHHELGDVIELRPLEISL